MALRLAGLAVPALFSVRFAGTQSLYLADSSLGISRAEQGGSAAQR